MKIINIITVLFVVLFVSCQREKIDNASMFKILTSAIDASLRLDPALNQGDTLYIGFPKGLIINNKVTNCLINYLSKKNKFEIVLSDIESVIKKDPVSPDHPNLRNFCITVLDVEYKTRSKIVVSTKKYKGMMGADIIETIFKFEKGNWIYNESRIVSAS